MTCYDALIARTRTIRRPIGPVAYDCVRVIVVRDGSAFLFSEFGQQPIKSGDVVLLGANVLCGSEPEGHITVTTVYLDTDYVLDQVRWQYAGFVCDRLDAQGFADAIYSEPAQILRLGEDRAGMLMPWLDELVALSVDGDFVRHYLRIQARRLTPDLGHADSSTLLGKRESKGWQGRTTRTSSGSGRWTCTSPRLGRR